MQITISIAAGTFPVTEFEPGEVYVIEATGYSPVTNAWLHASAGAILPLDPTTHLQADACDEAAYSIAPAATHEFMWTAPNTVDCVTISVAQAFGSFEPYNTAEVRPFFACVSCVHRNCVRTPEAR